MISHSLPNKNKPILLVDDSPGQSELLIQALARHGHQDAVHEEPSLESAFTYLDMQLRSSPTMLPQLILVDVNMDEGSGLELVRRLRSTPRLALLPVVMLSTSDDPRDIRAAYSAGANSYLAKPGTYEELVRMTRALCRYWLNWNLAYSRC